MVARTSAASSRCQATSPSRWRCATTATSSAVTTPTSATAAASSSPSSATTADRLLDLGTKGSGQTPYSRHADGRLTLKGGVREVLATEMLEALGVEHLEELRPVRNRRGAGARRRALPDPLVGADPAQPRPHPHRHLPAARLLRRGREHRQAASATASSNLYGEPRGGRCRQRAAAVRSGQPGDRCARRLLSRGRLRPRRAQQRQHQRSPAKASTTAPGASRPDGTRTSPRPISTITGSTPSAGSRRRSTGTSRSSPAASPRRRSPALSEMLGAWSDRFEEALVQAMLRRLGVASRVPNGTANSPPRS